MNGCVILLLASLAIFLSYKLRCFWLLGMMNDFELYSEHFRCCIPQYFPAGMQVQSLMTSWLVRGTSLSLGVKAQAPQRPLLIPPWLGTGAWPCFCSSLGLSWHSGQGMGGFTDMGGYESPHLCTWPLKLRETLLRKERAISSLLDTDACPTPYVASNGIKGRVITNGSSMGPESGRRHAFLQLGENESICSSLGLYWLRVEVGLHFFPWCLARVGQLLCKSFLFYWAIHFLVLWLERIGFYRGLLSSDQLAFPSCRFLQHPGQDIWGKMKTQRPYQPCCSSNSEIPTWCVSSLLFRIFTLFYY